METDNERIFVSATRVQERHAVILAAIGAFQQEKEAYELATLVQWTFPTIVIIATLVDFLLVRVYNHWVHPWREIVEENDPYLTP